MAFDIIDSITHDPTMSLDISAHLGDIQPANHYVAMHSRPSFVDDDLARYKNKLLLWLKMVVSRRLAPDFLGRGGFD